MRVEYGEGLAVAVLLSAALYLFGLISPVQALSTMLLLAGAWGIAFGIIIARKSSRLYYAGWGAGILLLSTFYVVPPQYTLGLLFLAIVVIILVAVYSRNRRSMPAS